MLVGVGGYAASRGLAPLPHARGDVERLAEVLRAGPTPYQVRMLHDAGDDPPTLGNLKVELRRLAAVAREDDLLFLYFSGHGVAVGDECYLMPSDGHREAPAETGLSLTWLRELMGSSAAAVRLLVVDACHAGAPGTKGSGDGPDAHSLTQALFLPAEGTAVLASARFDQVAAVDDTDGSVFTRFLADGLAGAAADQTTEVVTLSRLDAYTREQMRAWAFERGRSPQTPVLRAELDGEVPLRRVALGTGSAEIEPGRVVAGRYTVVRELGAGGMGCVYQARQSGVERDVALKVLTDRLAADDEARRRFEREARVVSGLRHPNTVTLYDFGVTDDGLAYMVMELLQGETLAAEIAREGRLATDRALRIAEQVCGSLAEAHRVGVVHRDLKPDNVFLDRLVDADPFVRVLDFGLARRPGSETKLTQTGALMGTPAYLSPEQARSQPVDTRSDLYQVGVLLYEMLAGRPPFVAETLLAYVFAHARTEPPSLTEACPELDPAVADVVHALLAKDPAERPASAAELVDTLRALRTGEAASAPAPVVEVVDASDPVVPARTCGWVPWVALVGVVLAWALWPTPVVAPPPVAPTTPASAVAEDAAPAVVPIDATIPVAAAPVDAGRPDAREPDARAVAKKPARARRPKPKPMPDAAVPPKVDDDIEAELRKIRGR